MKNKVGRIIGFIIGATGFLLLFKLIILKNIPPEDELAPGMVVIVAITIGFLFALMGSVTQNYFVKK